MSRALSLHTRISLVLSGVVACVLLAGMAFWVQGTRHGIHEEVDAATRVAQQWLRTLERDMAELPVDQRRQRLLQLSRDIGRIRANALSLHVRATGEALYASPPPSYKSGRSTPAWFTALLTPSLPPVGMAIGDVQVTLTPDASRAVLDCWDELQALVGWALLLLATLFLGMHWALRHALTPLAQVMDALERTGHGDFATRLPTFATPELAALAGSFNAMVDRLQTTLNDNVRLAGEREASQHITARLEDERRHIARELHDELAQCITAVRALAGAIVQRAPEQAGVHGPAQSIIAVTTAMQEGVRHILQRLRPGGSGRLDECLSSYLTHWQARHPEIQLECTLETIPVALNDALCQSVLRTLQEALTNILRHAHASHAHIVLARVADGITLSVRDNGSPQEDMAAPAGDTPPAPAQTGQPGCGLGLTGMRERIVALGGTLQTGPAQDGGFVVHAHLPLQTEISS